MGKEPKLITSEKGLKEISVGDYVMMKSSLDTCVEINGSNLVFILGHRDITYETPIEKISFDRTGVASIPHFNLNFPSSEEMNQYKNFIQ